MNSTERPARVEAAIQDLRRSSDYHDNTPKAYMRPDYGREAALLAYIEALEKENADLKDQLFESKQVRKQLVIELSEELAYPSTAPINDGQLR